jgi:predicted lipoprotein with Yx(FWY)xxD motif
MHQRRNSLFAFAAAALVAVALAACGGGDDSDNGSADGMAGGGETVATESISGVGNALVDSSGMVLYTNDMETGAKIVCTDQCLTEWLPLAAPGGGQPTADDSAVEAKLGTTQRPDGSSQVTFDGQPLYTFVDDSPGQATGNGFADSFGGTTFVWTAATASGDAAPSPSTTTDESSDESDDSGGVGGY